MSEVSGEGHGKGQEDAGIRIVVVCASEGDQERAWGMWVTEE